ncbi:hypothetical protein ES703_121398 [subsurface metagenome]
MRTLSTTLEILDNDNDVILSFNLNLYRVRKGKACHWRDDPTKTTCGIKGDLVPVKGSENIKLCGRCLEVCYMNARGSALWHPKYHGTLPPDFPLHHRIVGPSPEEMEAAKTPQGGWTKEQLADWGVPWPPPKGWRRELEEKWRQDHNTEA